jgi:hypothetical protein
MDSKLVKPWGPTADRNVRYYELWWLVGPDARDYESWWLVGLEGIAGVVKEEEGGSWVMEIFYWEEWDGAVGLPGLRG